MLHEVPRLPGPYLYCGPTAICAVTGMSQADVLSAARYYKGYPKHRPIVGMLDTDLIGTLAILGWRCTQFFTYSPFPTLCAFIRDMEQFDGAVIIRMHEHFACVTYTEYLDTVTNGLPVPLSAAPQQRRRVLSFLEVKQI